MSNYAAPENGLPRLLCPWDFPGKNTAVLVEWLAIPPFLGDLPSPGIEFTACAVSPSLLADSFPTEPQGKPKVKVLVAQLCPTLCYPVDCSPPGSSVHGILQARILEWVAIPFSRGYSQPRSPAHSLPSEPAGKLFTWAFTSCQIFAECLDMSLLTLTYKCLNCSAHSLLKESKERKRKWSRSVMSDSLQPHEL